MGVHEQDAHQKGRRERERKRERGRKKKKKKDSLLLEPGKGTNKHKLKHRNLEPIDLSQRS